jgi:hypothetical protein
MGVHNWIINLKPNQAKDVDRIEKILKSESMSYIIKFDPKEGYAIRFKYPSKKFDKIIGRMFGRQ